MKIWISSIIAGVYISLGAMIYLAVPDKIVGSLFFASGIMLVLNLHNRLVTRLCPLMAYNSSYHMGDVAVAWAGNGIGAVIAAMAVHFTRFEGSVKERIGDIACVKLGDDPVSLIILGILCGVFVAFAVVLGTKYPKGSFAQIFYVWLFITGFVLCGFEHIVADMFYIVLYGVSHGISAVNPVEVLKVLVCVSAGNFVGGFLTAVMIKRLDAEN